MAAQNENPMKWCLRQIKLAGPDAEVCVSLYFVDDDAPGFTLFELGVTLNIGSQTRRIPLNFTRNAALSINDGGMYESYAYLADDYVTHLREQGLRARRVLAPFEHQLRQSSPSIAANS